MEYYIICWISYIHYFNLEFLIIFIYFYLILKWDIESNYDKWLKNITINHTKEVIIRAFLLIPCILTLFLHLYDANPTYAPIKMGVCVGLVGSVWWEFFDGWYNKKRGFSWRFNGSDDKDDTMLDNLRQTMSPNQQALLKWGLISLFTILYLIL